jgi:hypothetical protein
MIPIEHYKSTRSLQISNPILSTQFSSEVDSLILSLDRLNGDNLVYEVFGGHGNSIHLNANVIPISSTLYDTFKDTLARECAAMGMGLGSIPTDASIPYIKLKYGSETLVYTKQELGAVFEFNIVRRCLCVVLELESRIEWRDCGEAGGVEIEEIKERYAVLNL